MAENRAVIAAAGSRKTAQIIEEAISVRSGRVLITTYTNENQQQLIRRIEEKLGAVPANITVMGWFTFLIGQCAKPFQRTITGAPLMISGLNFVGKRHKFARKDTIAYFLDRSGAMYRDGVASFVIDLNQKTGGAVVDRLERIYSHIYIDEVQDLVGYDLDVLDLLLRSRIKLTTVGDPRQHTLATNICTRNKKYRGDKILDWFEERRSICHLETRTNSYRCNQAVCDFADALYPHMTPTSSIGVPTTGHDGIFMITSTDSRKYCEKYNPVTVLRHDKNTDTLGLPAMNIGVSKGSTFDRVMIFPTQPMLGYLKNRDVTKLKAPERLYVAVTRARHSVAFVIPTDKAESLSLFSF